MSIVSIGSEPEGHVAKVDSEGRLHTRSACLDHEVTTTRGAYDTTNVAVVASALAGCCEVVIQNKGTVPFRIAVGATDPVGGDYEIAAGQTFVLPFAYSGEIRGQGVGGTGSFVTFQAKQAS